MAERGRDEEGVGGDNLVSVGTLNPNSPNDIPLNSGDYYAIL